jgi:hypothetical protein
MSTNSNTSASNDDPNILIPLLTFILTDEGDRTFKVPVQTASSAEDANIGR